MSSNLLTESAISISFLCTTLNPGMITSMHKLNQKSIYGLEINDSRN
uniref:Uncharacterized protein n=1 Tax=Rhizophora mucronata TaxID=61149 RepID=A0A2P2Q039_RHIMU